MTTNRAAEPAKTVWAVTKGEYSDYRVLCVCPTQKQAQLVAAAYNEDSDRWKDARVEMMAYVDGRGTGDGVPIW